MAKLIRLSDLSSGYKEPIYIENFEKPERSQWAFFQKRMHPASAWLVFLTQDNHLVGYSMENYGRKWLMWSHNPNDTEIKEKIGAKILKWLDEII